MGIAAKKITNLRPPEHDFQENTPVEPWLRQKNEPALWFMRFSRYRDMGHKRSMRAVLASEPQDAKVAKGNKNQSAKSDGKKISDISVPGAWSRAAKVWRWKARCEAFDLAEQAKQSRVLRKMATGLSFASRSYRLIQMNYMAMILRSLFEPGTPVTRGDLPLYLAAMARYQSVLRDIETLMQGIDGITLEACDAAALESISKELETRKAVDKEISRRKLK